MEGPCKFCQGHHRSTDCDDTDAKLKYMEAGYKSPHRISPEKSDDTDAIPQKYDEPVLNEREGTHGDWQVQSQCASDLKAVIRKYGGTLPAYQREALEMSATKWSRIMCGNSMETDHWVDLAGYAKLGIPLVKP